MYFIRDFNFLNFLSCVVCYSALGTHYLYNKNRFFNFHQMHRVLNDQSITLALSTTQLKPALRNNNLKTVDT